MIWRTVPALALLALAAAPPLRAAEPAPTITARLASVNDLLKKVEYAGEQAGQGNLVQQGSGMLRAFEDPDSGVEGIDPARPIGLYAVLTPEVVDGYAALVVPLKSEEAFLNLLRGKLNLAPKKGADGVYSVDVPQVPLPVLFAFAHKSLYISARTPEALKVENLLPPEKLHADAPAGLFGLRVHLDRVPESVRTIVLGQIELKTAEAKAAGKPDDVKQLSKEFGATVARDAIKALLKEGASLTARLDIDAEKENVLAELLVAPKAGSPLAKSLMEVGRRTSRFTGLGGSETLGGAGVRFVLPPETNELLRPIWDDGHTNALTSAPEAERPFVEPFVKVLFDTLRAGDIDAAISFRRGPENALQGIAGASVVGGERLAAGLKAVYDINPPKEATIAFATGQVAGVTLHEGTVTGEKFRKETGTDKMFLGTADKVVLASVGPDAASLKEAAAATGGPAPLASLDLRLAGLMQSVDGDVSRKEAARIARRVYGGDADGRDRLRASVTAGETLTFRFDMHGQLIAFFTALDKAKKGNAEEEN